MDNEELNDEVYVNNIKQIIHDEIALDRDSPSLTWEMIKLMVRVIQYSMLLLRKRTLMQPYHPYKLKQKISKLNCVRSNTPFTLPWLPLVLHGS